MVLGSDVKDLSGRMLLKSGTEIGDKHLKVLRTWGVAGVDVENADDGDVATAELELEELPHEIIMAIEYEVGKRFVGVDISHPVMMALVDTVKRDLAKKYLNEFPSGTDNGTDS